jgi:4-hydroxy-tetrahydrodipicolinate reductase
LPSQTVRVAVAGTTGRMGTIAREALQSSGEYCCGLARRADREHAIFDSLERVVEQKPDVLLDLTTQPGSYEISCAAVSRGLHTVVGASGWDEERRTVLGALAQEHGVGAFVVPNFSLGAMLMMRFAAQAARYFPEAEIVELHHAGKKDKPSGTARETAAKMERAGGRVREIHSIRLPGLLAHQEVLFGGTGELLTIRHDSFSRESFVAGMLAAVRAVVHRRGLSVGLDAILDDSATAFGETS